MRMRPLLLLAFAAAVVTIPLAAGSAGANAASRPFKGSMSGAVTFVVDTGCPFGMRSDSAATGTASHFGKFTFESSHCSGVTFAGEEAIVAANGDELFADYENFGPPVPLPSEVGTVYDIPVVFTITGGTGRFSDATGGGYMTAHLTFMGLGVPTWPCTWDWQGTIGY
jgi:hypothetical protein